MTLEQAYFITQIVVGIGFIISIIFLAVQVRQNSFLLRNSMADQRAQKIIGSLKHCAPIMTFGLSIGRSGMIGKTLTMTRNTERIT